MRSLASNLFVGLALIAGVNHVVADSISLAWNPNSDPTVIGYKIYYGTTSQTYFTNVVVGTITNATISGLTDGITYYFAATSYDAAGDESGYSDEVSYTLPSLSPTLDPIANVSVNENAGPQTINLTGISAGNTNGPQVVTITAISSDPTIVSTPAVNYNSPNVSGTLAFAPVPGAWGTATITVTVNNGGASNNVAVQSFTVTVNAVNQPPTLNPIAALSVNENAGLQTVNLTGISSGAPNQPQSLAVSAASSNPALVPTPTVNYTSPNSSGSLAFTPAPNAFGTATITVTVNNGGASNNVISQNFTVTVNPVNQPPTLNAISNLSVSQNAGTQTVNLSGITSGNPGQNQAITVTATSGNPALVPTPTVNYTSPNSSGSLAFTPAPNAFGTATITVMVNNGGASNNVISQNFTVTVNPVNQPPTLNAISNLSVGQNAGTQTVNLSGITSGNPGQNQTITVTATSGNPALIPAPGINYTSPNATGTLTFAPLTNAYGTAAITVVVNNGGPTNNLVSQTFTVTVSPPSQSPTLNPIPNLTINENTNRQTIQLTGISSGTTNPAVTITASSSNTGLVQPYVTYTSPNNHGSLTFKPSHNTHGAATITVTVNNGTKISNLISRSFTVTVLAPKQTAPLDVTQTVGTALLTQVSAGSGQFTFTVSGSPGTSYVVQVSPDLINWTALQTNTSPFTVVDTNALNLTQRYYRASIAQ